MTFILDLSEHFEIYCGLRTHFFFINGENLSYVYIYFFKSSVYIPELEKILATTPKRYSQNFKNLIGKRLLKDIH